MVKFINQVIAIFLFIFNNLAASCNFALWNQDPCIKYLFFSCLRLIARITSSVQGTKPQISLKKLDVTNVLKTSKFEGFDRESRPRPL